MTEDKLPTATLEVKKHGQWIALTEVQYASRSDAILSAYLTLWEHHVEATRISFHDESDHNDILTLSLTSSNEAA